MTAKNKEDNAAIEGSSAPILDHLIELRKRLMISVAYVVLTFAGCLFFSAHIYAFLAAPFVDIAADNGQAAKMIMPGIQDGFMVNFRLSFYCALVFSFPLVAIEIWKFVAPGLYANEKKAFAPFLIATPFLFICGGALAYYLVIPNAFAFFMSYQMGSEAVGELEIETLPAVQEYLSLVLLLIFAFSVTFLLPILILLLAKVGIVTADGLAAKRKYMVLAGFVFAAFITPPDPMSQVGLAIPLILLYEISIIIIRITDRKKKNV
jgi:sec-independent protein translocase protein TatC